jgi:hypothetical protein
VYKKESEMKKKIEEKGNEIKNIVDKVSVSNFVKV